MYCILLTVEIVVAAILSLLAAPESAVMTAPGAAGSDGAVAMTIAVSQYHWNHVCDLPMFWMHILSYIVLFIAESEMT